LYQAHDERAVDTTSMSNIYVACRP
jgi:hypothetical protein